MTSPGSEHVSRYRALGEFDNLVRAAKEAKRALKELREEEAKLNAQSIADDKKVTASKNERAKAEQASAAATKKSVEDLNKDGHAGKAGEAAGVQYTKGVGAGISREAAGSNPTVKKSLEALQQLFAKAGDESGKQYLLSAKQRFSRDSDGALRDNGIEYALRQIAARAGRAGEDTGIKYVEGVARKLKKLNETLGLVGFDELDLDVDVKDASKSIKSLEADLKKLNNETVLSAVRIDTNRALSQLREIDRLFRDEVAQNQIKEAERIQREELRQQKLAIAESARLANQARREEEKEQALARRNSEREAAQARRQEQRDQRQAILDAKRQADQARRDEALARREEERQIRLALREIALAQRQAAIARRQAEKEEEEARKAVRLENERIRKELAKLDALPSGRAFKFWALTALSDMSKVFQEADRGTSIFERLRKSISAGGGGGGGNFLNSFVSGFDDFSESTSKLLQRLGRVSGELYRMPGIIAVLVASLPALIAGLGALGGGALGLASGLGAVSGLVLAFPGLAAAMIGSVGALSSTFGSLADVLKEAKKAQAEELYEKEKARLGTDKALTPLQKYTALINDMLPATQTTTLAIVEFADSWTNVSERVGENFFKEVVGDVERLPQVLAIAENFFGKAATALGRVTSEGIKMLTSGPWKRDFAIIAENNADVIENFGFAGLSLAEAFKNIAIAAGPFNGWLTRAIRDAADAFAEWTDSARESGAIEAFLGETQESLQSVWQIIKNLGSIISSFFKSTVDEGQSYLRTLEDITGHWSDVAKAQEEANSPLRQWMVQIRPILSALGALIGDLGRGIAGLATNQNSVQSMVDLLDSLRTKVLPPILSILQHLNDSGIAVTVVNALGEILEAIATFLDSGATQALSVFVTVLAEFFSLVANIASLPGVSDILGGLAAGIATIAAVSVVARFTGLFKLWDFFTWMSRNRGNLSGAFSDAARGVAGLSVGSGTLPTNIPSTIANGPGTGGIGSEVRNINNVGNASQANASKVGIFSRALSGITSAGATAGRALSSFAGFLGGPWGIALVAATVGIGVISSDIAKQKKEVQDTKDAWLALADAYKQLEAGDTSGVEGLAKTNEKFKDLANAAEDYGINLTDLSGALNGNEQATARVTGVLDAQAAAYKAAYMEGKESQGVTNLNQLGLKRFRTELENTANAQRESNKLTDQSAAYGRTYQERLAGMTQAQVDTAVAAQDMTANIKLLSGALDTMASSSSTSADRSKALSDIIGYTKGPMEAANEAAENWNSTLLTLSETAEANGRSLSKKTREGLRNRDALEEAAKATRDLYLEDIASGVPMDEALKRHQKRIKELKEEAEKTYGQKKAVKELIDVYGDIPDNMKTNILTDEKGFAAVYVELAKLQVMQKALQEGKSLSQAQADWNKESGKFYQRYIPNQNTGDGYGAPRYATGGPVWGAGTKTSDSIRAWLSNGEFVQPTDAVEHYGMPIMEAIRSRSLDKTVIEEALPDASTTAYATGGPAHSDNCAACSSGGHKFATGGTVKVPIIVNPSNTKIDKDWVNSAGGPLGSGSGGGGWQWQMKVLRQAFPGLPLWSGYRPGSTTLSGNKSYHSMGRAVDLPPRRDVAQWIRSNYGSRTKELITPFNDLNLWNGKPHRYTGAVWNQHNFAGGNAHDHWAFNQGGLVDLMKMMNMDNLAPSQNSSLPSTPRSLSSAASSVVNNSADNTRTFGDVIINNPAPERAGDSIRDALYRTQLLY